jgi:hypothetical protein
MTCISKLLLLKYVCVEYMNGNQRDALFTFGILSYHTSTCFGLSAAHNQEVVYMWQMVLVVLLS